jgi:hypothetical protein
MENLTEPSDRIHQDYIRSHVHDKYNIVLLFLKTRGEYSFYHHKVMHHQPTAIAILIDTKIL